MVSKNESKSGSTGKELAELPATNSGAVALPSFMQGAASGKDNIGMDDLIIPRVALMQGISPPVMQGIADNATFWHTINEEVLGTELGVIPILHRKQWTIWKPTWQGGGVIARSSDGKTWDADFSGEIQPYKDMPKKLVKVEGKKGDPVGRDVGYGRWGTMDPDNEDSGPMATLSHVVMMVAPDRMDFGPFIVFLQRSSERVAREFLSKIQIDKAPIYGQQYVMGSRVVPNGAGQEYNQYTFRKNGHVQDEELFFELQRMHELYKSVSFRTNDENAQEEAGAAGEGAGEAPAKDGGEDKY